MTATDHPSETLPYPLWVEEALRGVVRRALEHTAGHGLIGDHHYYISFRTTADGVDIAGHIRARHPEEMTIVLQHQFWDLEVGPEAFSVSLRFGGRLTPLRIPFAAISAFGDPSVNFGLQFTVPPAAASPQLDAAPTGPQTASPALPQPAGAADPEQPPEGEKSDKGDAGRVIAFDAFRKK